MELYEAQGDAERFLMQKAEARYLPFGGAMELLPLCNMRCRMCYIRACGEAVGEKILPAEEWIRIGRQCVDAGVLYMLLTGGEPLLHPEFEKIYLALKNMGLVINLNTNGTLIDEARADFFAQNPCRKINITLYGAGPETYGRLCGYPQGFEKTVHAIRLLKERGLLVNVNLTFTRDNAADLEEMLSLCADLGVGTKPVFYMFPPLRGGEAGSFRSARLSPEEAAAGRVRQILLKDPEKSAQEKARLFLAPIKYPIPLAPYGKGFYCSAARSGFWISWQGKLLPCGMASGFEEDLKELSFSEAWGKIVERGKETETCRACQECAKRLLCPTCAAATYCETGSYAEKPDYLCRMTDAAIEIMLSYLEKEEADTYRAML